MFFLERAYKISKKNRYVLGFCSLTILGGLALGLGAAIATITQPTGDSVSVLNFSEAVTINLRQLRRDEVELTFCCSFCSGRLLHLRRPDEFDHLLESCHRPD